MPKRSHEDDETLPVHYSPSPITCTLPPHQPQTLATQEEFEAHYATFHTNICTSCGHNFPGEKLLELHIAENHDPFTKIKIEKGEPVFQCFVNGCNKFFTTHKKRRLHLIDKHQYPKEFLFSVVDRGISRHQVSLLKQEISKK